MVGKWFFVTKAQSETVSKIFICYYNLIDLKYPKVSQKAERKKKAFRLIKASLKNPSGSENRDFGEDISRLS